MRPNPCLPSDTIVIYISPFIAGTPPVSSSGRGRGSISASFVYLCRSVFPFAVIGGPFCVPPACGERGPLGPACGRGQSFHSFYFSFRGDWGSLLRTPRLRGEETSRTRLRARAVGWCSIFLWVFFSLRFWYDRGAWLWNFCFSALRDSVLRDDSLCFLGCFS